MYTHTSRPALERLARPAGALYLAIAIAGGYSMGYLPAVLTVAGDASATAGNFVSHPSMVRLGIAADMIVMMAELAATAKAVGTIANVEDVKEYCDFFSPARVQRGDLMITVSTNGHSPRLAGRIRRALENWLVPSWDKRLRELSDQREKWKADGADMQKLLKMTDEYIDRRGWL